MHLKKILTKESVVEHLNAETKPAIIEELINHLCSTGKVKDRDEALKCVLDRESKMSTGMQNGIAIPHGKTNAVDELLVAVAIKKEGVDFDAMDRQPCTIFVITLSPENRTGPHIQFLAEISKILGNETLRDQLIHSSSADEMLKLLTT